MIAALTRGEAQKTVLVIEDDPDFATFLVDYLGEHGCRAYRAGHHQAALKLAVVLDPDFITLDIGLPEQSGLFLFHRLRACDTLRNTPIVVITGLSRGRPDMDELIREFTETTGLVPPVAYLEKPVDVTQLLEALSAVQSSPAAGGATAGPGDGH